jgi:hypothetical protein
VPRWRSTTLEEIAHDAGAELILDAFKWLDADGRTVRTGGGEAIQDVEGGYVRRLGFLAPTPMPWPMPLYELALMTARPRRDRRTAGGRLRPGDRLSGRRSDRARALPPHRPRGAARGREAPLPERPPYRRPRVLLRDQRDPSRVWSYQDRRAVSRSLSEIARSRGITMTSLPESPRPIPVVIADDASVVRRGLRQVLDFDGGLDVLAEAWDRVSARATSVAITRTCSCSI